MPNRDLSSRKKQILRAVIDEYIRSGEPIGSKYLAQNQQLSCSSATIRNEMAELEALGLLEQPHTSAGRVPTEAGYRYYVNSLVCGYAEVAQDIQQMSVSLRRKLGELDQILAEASRMAAALTNYPGIAVKAQPKQVVIARFEGVYVEPRKHLLVMIFASGTVRSKTLSLDQDLTKEELEEVISICNECLVGRTAEGINMPVLSEMEFRLGSLAYLAGIIAKIVYDTMLELGGGDLRVEGVNRLLQYPEYEDIDVLRNMIALFEDKQDLLSAISTSPDHDGVRVVIGSENTIKVMNNSALIYRPVRVDNRVIGAIGVVGPCRMDYARVIPTIDNLAKELDRLLSSELPSIAPSGDGE